MGCELNIGIVNMSMYLLWRWLVNGLLSKLLLERQTYPKKKTIFSKSYKDIEFSSYEAWNATEDDTHDHITS